MVQWLGLCPSTARDMGSIPSREAKILHATWPKKKKKERKIIAFSNQIGSKRGGKEKNKEMG